MRTARKSKGTSGIRRVRHGDDVVYCVWVLWLMGFTETKIGAQLNLSKGQVAGIVLRSDYANRRAMSDEYRQEKYDDIVSKRFDAGGNAMDGGRLKTIPKKILPIIANRKNPNGC